MNSRSSVKESNLVNLSANLSTLDALDTKDSLSLSFPFDHIYACHSESSDRRQALSVDKDVEISTHCVVADQKDLLVSTSTEINRLSERLTAAENQNKKLKDLLVYHLDLIQQQNDVITKREKLYQALKQENDSLKSRVIRMDRKGPTTTKHSVTFPAPIEHVPPVSIKSEPGTSSQVMLNSLTELLLPDNRTNPYIFSDVTKPTPFAPDPFDLSRGSDTNVSEYLSNLGVSSILDSSIPCDNLTMIENKPSSYIKKEIKKETRPEPLYTITSNSGNPVIKKFQRSRRRTSGGLGSLSRMPKVPPVKVEPPETGLNLMFDDDTCFEDSFSVNKKSKMINTYGKSKSNVLKNTSQFTGSLSDRLKLIDTTPTGEDPYQLGEADMREQSPIPKLMLQKTNHGRMRVCGGSNFGSGSTTSTRRIYDVPATQTSTTTSNKIKLEGRYNLTSTTTQAELNKETSEPKISSLYSSIHDTGMDLNKPESDIEWRLNSSVSDFGYGDSDCTQTLNRIHPEQFRALMESSDEAKKAADAFENLDMKAIDEEEQRAPTDNLKKRGPRTTSLMTNDILSEQTPYKRGSSSKRGRKRALSTTGLAKGGKNAKIPKTKQVKGKAACRGKKSPVPGMTSSKPYNTLMGDPDLSWYFGLDPELKMEDIDQPGSSTASTVEVPSWREKPYTSCYTMEGTENLDDKVFEKRHQKLEAEERRQLRWHMRRVREQRHVERLRQRQRDSWCSGLSSSSYQQPSVYTIWPQPQRDLKAIEITDTLPVLAFGEDLPELAPSDFKLPWVRKSKALKRSKRSKTLH